MPYNFCTDLIVTYNFYIPILSFLIYSYFPPTAQHNSRIECKELVTWWEDYSLGNEERRRELMESARKLAQSRPREPKPAPRDPRSRRTMPRPRNCYAVAKPPPQGSGVVEESTGVGEKQGGFGVSA